MLSSVDRPDSSEREPVIVATGPLTSDALSAEIAGLFPNKSGGASVYGATAWLRYSKFIAPLSVWCNWFAWSPVQATGSALAARARGSESVIFYPGSSRECATGHLNLI